MSSLMAQRSLGIVAAIAVSGTALYIAYGFKRRAALEIIRRGKGSLRLEVRPAHKLKREPSVPIELVQSKEINIAGVNSDNVPWYRGGTRCQQQQEQGSSPLLRLSGPAAAEEEELRLKLEKCSADVALVKSLQDTLASYKIAVDSLSGRFENSPDASPDKFQDSFQGPGNLKIVGRAESPSPCEGGSLSPSSSSVSSSDDDCSSKTLSSAGASSTKFALVGCFVGPGSKRAGKPKKMVRFSPSVVEPSSNNQDYRTRTKAVMLQRTREERARQRAEIEERAAASYARLQQQGLQPAHPTPSESSAVRSCYSPSAMSVYDRPRLHSHAARQTSHYGMYHRPDARYMGRTSYHF